MVLRPKHSPVGVWHSTGRSHHARSLVLDRGMLSLDSCGDILERAMAGYGYRGGAILVKQPDGECFAVAAHAGLSSGSIELLRVMASTTIAAGASRGRVLVFGRSHQTDQMLRHLSCSLGGGDLVVVPMMSRDEMVGMLLLGNRTAHGRVGAAEKASLLTVAALAAVVHERSQAEQQLSNLNHARRSLIAATAGPSSGLSAWLQQILVEALEMLAVDAAAIFLLEPVSGDFIMQAQVGLNSSYVGRVRLPSSSVSLNGDAERGSSVIALLSELEMGPIETREDVTAVEYIRADDSVLGLLAVYTPADVEKTRWDARPALSALAMELAPVVAATVRVRNDLEPGGRLDQLDEHHAGFTSLISHQLRTPLTSIRGYAQLLLRQMAPDPAIVHQYAAVIVEKSGHLIDSIEEVRGLAEVTADLLALKSEPLQIAPLIRRVIASMQPYSRNPLLTSLGHETTLVKADQEKISKVVSSLICNAMRRSPNSLPIRVGTELKPRGLSIWVGDRGSRLSQQEAESAFEWGRPSDDGIDDAGVRANALALYASGRIVQAHGGRVWVESDEDETRFCFELTS